MSLHLSNHTNVMGQSIDELPEFDEKCLKKVKIESPEKKVQEVEDDPEACIFKARANKGMPPRLMTNWKSLQEDPALGFKQRGLYYPRISQEKKTNGRWVMYCVPCAHEHSINPSYNLLNMKTHLSPKFNGVETAHEKNWKSYLNKEIAQEKLTKVERAKDEAILKKRTEWVQKWALEGIMLPISCMKNFHF
jgi:hypothetical protein